MHVLFYIHKTQDKGKGYQELISVHLGPARFIENQERKIKGKVRMLVRRSQITFQNKQVIIAAEITKRAEESAKKMRQRNFSIPAASFHLSYLFLEKNTCRPDHADGHII